MAMNGWDRFAMGGVSTGRKMGGLTMVRKRPTRRKRRPGDIWAQLSVSACVLLLPPLVMAAGVMVFGSSSPPGQQVAVQEAAAPQAAAANASASPAQRSFDLASAETRPVISEKGPLAGPRPASERPTVAAPRAPIGQAAGAKDTTRYSGAPPVTLANIGKAGEQSAIAEVGAPSPAAAARGRPCRSPGRHASRHAKSQLSKPKQAGAARAAPGLSGEIPTLEIAERHLRAVGPPAAGLVPAF